MRKMEETKMKKILALTLCVVMAAAAFTGCGNKSSNGEADGAPITVISREDGSGTRGAFTELMGVMVDDVDNTTTSAEISQSTSVVLTTVAGNKNSIGYVSLGSLNDTVKAVKVDGVELTNAEACAWVAAATAAAKNTQSNTYVEYEGATEVVGAKSHEEAVAAINNGEFFFSVSEAGAVVVEYDINTLVTFKDGKDKTYRKNRVIRVFDTFAEALQLNFPPNKYDNSSTGWDIMEGIGRTILKQFEDAGAITAVDYDNDFLVDREASHGDETYFNVGLQPVDSAEKLYFTISTR